MGKRNTRKVDRTVLNENRTDYARDARGRKVMTNETKTRQDHANMQSLTELLERYPLANDLFTKMIEARADMIKSIAQGKTISDPMYLWEPAYQDDYGMNHPQSVRVVPHSEVGDGMGYTSVRDLLDAFYYNLGYDEEGNKMHDFEKEDFYNLASQRLLDLAAETQVDANGNEVPTRPELLDYIHRQGYNPAAGGYNPNILNQSQEWQEPTFTASALGLLAPRETPMKLDPEMQSVIKLGNPGKEYEAALGDVAENAASVAAKPYKALRWLLGKGERTAWKLAPKVMARMSSWDPKISKVLRTPSVAMNKIDDLAVRHPTTASAIEGAVANSGIYALGKGYNEAVDPENYFESSPYNNRDLAFAAAFGAGVPVAGGIAAKFGHFGPFRDLAEAVERNTLSKDDRIRQAFGGALALRDPQVAKNVPSSIPKEWLKDLYMVEQAGVTVPTANWNMWLNAGMNRLYKKYPELRYGWKTTPPSNIEKFGTDEGLQTAQSMGFGDAKSGVRKVADEKTGRIGKQSYTMENGVRTPITTEQTDKFKAQTPYSIEDWRKGLSGTQRGTLDTEGPYRKLTYALAKNQPGNDADLDLITANPMDESNRRVVSPERYATIMGTLENDDVKNYLREKAVAVTEGGVPMRHSVQSDLRATKQDRFKRQAAFNKLGSDVAASPLVDLEDKYKLELVPVAIGGLLRGAGRTAGRNIIQSGNKNEYVDKE